MCIRLHNICLKAAQQYNLLQSGLKIGCEGKKKRTSARNAGRSINVDIAAAAALKVYYEYKYII